MPASKQEIDRLIESLSRSWDGHATGEELEFVEGFVRKHGSEGAGELMRVSSLHLELQRMVDSSRVYEQAMDRVRAAAQLEEATTGVSLPTAGSCSGDARRRQGRRSGRRKLLLVAASLLVASVALSLLVKPIGWRRVAAAPSVFQLIRPSQPVASVVSLENALWESGDDIVAGCNLKQDRRLALLEGQAHLSMAFGADLVLQAPCVVTLVGDDEVRLNRGTLTAQSAEWATGFAVTTDDLKVTDLGTRFAVSSDGAGVVEAHVLEGEILAEPLLRRRPRRSLMLLGSGQAIRVDPLRSSVDLFAARRTDFVDEIEGFRPLRPIAMWNTGVGLNPGDPDPRWRLTAGSPGAGPYPRPPVVTPGDTRSYKDNKPEVSQWISVDEEPYPGVPPETVHTFETTFDLDGYDLETVYVVAQVLVDDAVDEFRINGRPVAFERWQATWKEFDFKSFHPIEIVDGFVAGKNTVAIDVRNSPSKPDSPGDFNPTALRVEWQAFGCELQP